jgi:hypothetical protein
MSALRLARNQVLCENIAESVLGADKAMTTGCDPCSIRSQPASRSGDKPARTVLSAAS